MTALVVAQGLVIYLALAWKLLHLARAPRDVPLRCVVACLACAGLAYPFGIAFAARPGAPGARWVMLIQCSLLLGTVLFLDCFFLVSLVPRAAARRAVWRMSGLAAAIAVMAVAAALVPAGAGMTGQAVPAVAVLYLAFDAAMGWFLADTWRWMRRGITGAPPALARGLRLASAGIAVMVAGLVLLAGVVIMRWARVPSPAALVSAGQAVVTPGVLVFLAGICYPGAVMRLSALRLWRRHRRAYRQLAPLWEVLHGAFPQDRMPSSRWRDTISPWSVHRRYYRRVIECRDGLVRVSPSIACPDGQPELAERLLAVLRGQRGAEPAPARAIPVAVPSAPGLDADAAELMHLARQVAAARSRSQKDS